MPATIPAALRKHRALFKASGTPRDAAFALLGGGLLLFACLVAVVAGLAFTAGYPGADRAESASAITGRSINGLVISVAAVSLVALIWRFSYKTTRRDLYVLVAACSVSLVPTRIIADSFSPYDLGVSWRISWACFWIVVVSILYGVVPWFHIVYGVRADFDDADMRALLGERPSAQEEGRTWMTYASISVVVIGFLIVQLRLWTSENVWLVFTTAILAIWVGAGYLDRNRTIVGDFGYAYALSNMATGSPTALGGTLATIVGETRDSSEYVNVLVVAGISTTLVFAHFLWRMLALAAMPWRHAVASQFALQLLEDLFLLFAFVNVRPLGLPFFLILSIQVGRSIFRDAGLQDDLLLYVRNRIRVQQGLPPVEAGHLELLDQWRLFLQNTVSELAASLIFLCIIGIEQADSSDSGKFTDRGSGDRVNLAVGYFFVLIADLGSHFACRRILTGKLKRAAERSPESASEAAPEALAPDSPAHADPNRSGTAAALADGQLSIRRQAFFHVWSHLGYFAIAITLYTFSALGEIARLREGVNKN